MGHPLVGDEAEIGSGGDGCGSGAGFHLEAAHVGAVDVGHAVVILVVLRLSDGRPFSRFGHAVDDELGEAIWGMLVRGFLGGKRFVTMGARQACEKQESNWEMHFVRQQGMERYECNRAIEHEGGRLIYIIEYAIPCRQSSLCPWSSGERRGTDSWGCLACYTARVAFVNIAAAVVHVMCGIWGNWGWLPQGITWHD